MDQIDPDPAKGRHGWRVMADAVHGSVYADPDVFREERARVFRRAWLFAAHESMLPRPGDCLAFTLAGLPIILVRGRDGEVRTFFNRCPHRGARLVEDGRARLRQFRCLYHGWTFDLDGRRLSIPLRDGYEETGLGAFHWADGLAGAGRVEDYRGFLFVTFDPGAPALSHWLGGVAHVLDNIVDRAPAGRVTVGPRPYRIRIRANWKLYLENLQDAVHPHAAHESSIDAAEDTAVAYGLADGAPFRIQLLRNNGAPFAFFEQLEQVAYDNGHTTMGGMIPSVPTGPDAALREALMAAKGAAEAERILSVSRHNTIVWPNLAVQSAFGQLRVVHPVAVDETVVEVHHLRLEGAPDGYYEARTLAYTNTVNAPSTMISADDIDTFRRVQEGLAAGEPEWMSLHRDAGRDVTIAGVTTAIGTSELPQRNQLAAWRRFMTD